MFAPETIMAFAAATFAVYLAPGPDMAFISSNAFARGVRGGLAAAAGVTTGVWAQALLTAFGLGAVFAAQPVLFEAARWFGVAYLVYLGVRLLRTNDPSPVCAEEKLRSLTVRDVAGIWVRGLAINLLNPKITIFFVSFLPQFVDPSRGDVTAQLLALALTFSAGAIAWTALQAVAFARIGSALGNSPTVARWQRRVTGTAFLAFAGILATSSLRRG